MVITDEQKYSAVLKELGEVLQDKNTTISCQKWQIDELKAKLEAAEKERDEARRSHKTTTELLEVSLEEVNHMRTMLETAKKERDEAVAELKELLNEGGAEQKC